MIRVVTDSTCDLPAEVIEELCITVIPLYINGGDQGFLDGVEITLSAFYTDLPDYEVHPTIGTPGPESFIQTFSALEEEVASEILSIHIAESLSATVQVARAAASQFEGIPDTKVYSMDITPVIGAHIGPGAVGYTIISEPK